MNKLYTAILSRAKEIRDETHDGKNTALRVGNLLCDMATSFQTIDEQFVDCKGDIAKQSERIDKFESSSGDVDGLAPLDAAAQVPEWHMPPGVFDIVGFHGFVDAGEVSVVDSQAAAILGHVVCCAGRFVFKSAAVKPGLGLPSVYTGWTHAYRESHGDAIKLHEVNTSLRYGSPSSTGVTPVRGKLYVDLNTATPYVYDGSALVALTTAADVAAMISAAVRRGEAGGTVPLDADGMMPEWALPPQAFQVLPFGGFIDSGNYELTLQPEDGSYQSVMFYGGHFVATPGRSYQGTAKLYTRWTVAYKETVAGSAAVRRRTVDASLRYGSPTDLGIQPSASKIYIDTTTRTAYIYDGEGGLIPISTPPSLARVADTE